MWICYRQQQLNFGTVLWIFHFLKLFSFHADCSSTAGRGGTPVTDKCWARPRQVGWRPISRCGDIPTLARKMMGLAICHHHRAANTSTTMLRWQLAITIDNRFVTNTCWVQSMLGTHTISLHTSKHFSQYRVAMQPFARDVNRNMILAALRIAELFEENVKVLCAERVYVR